MAEQGGRARLVKVVDKVGNAVTVSYDPANQVQLRLTDDLGHSLEVRGTSACTAYASELRYDGVTVARYTMSGNMLNRVTDADGKTLRSYAYGNIGLYWPRLMAVSNESGTAIAEFSYDNRGTAIGVIDSESSVAARYDVACGWDSARWNCITFVTATEYFHGRLGDTSEKTVRMFDYNGHLRRIEEDCSCGPARALSWTDLGQLRCSVDGMGHRDVRETDNLHRIVHRVEFNGSPPIGRWWPQESDCALPNPLPDDAREEWREYGITRPIAQGLVLNLDVVTSIRRRSGLQSGAMSEEKYDYNQAPASIDPSGYTCTQSPLPAGSVVCRQVSSGYVTVSGSPVLERHATFFSYDSRGRMIRKYGPVNLDRPGPNDVVPIEERVYWGDGESSARQARLYQVKRYASPTAQPLVTSYDYDLFGVSRITAPDGTQTLLVKDGRGRPTLVVIQDAGGAARAQTETRYYDGSTPRLRILPSGAAERYSYDSKGRLSQVEYLSGDPEASGANPTLGWSESYVYDQAGNRIHSERRDAQGNVTWQQDRAYDVQHHVVWESNPSLPSTGREWMYDSSGFLTGMVDEEGRVTTFVPDGLSRVTRVQRSGQNAQGSQTALEVAAYQYGAGQDALVGVTDGAGRLSGYVYDDFGRVERVSSPSLSRGGGVWYQYDTRGNVVGRGDSDVTVTYTYDGLDRLLTMAAQNSRDGSVVSYQYRYDEAGFIGRLTSMVEPERTATYTYDWAGRLLTEVMTENGVPVPFTTRYSYDANGALQQLSYPSGLTIQLDRDPATRQVTRVWNAADNASFAASITRYPGGPIAGLQFGNGRTLTQTFNQRYEPLSIHDGPVWLSYSPTPAGDIGVVVDQSEDPSGCVLNSTRAFRYDFLDRLSGWNDTVQSGTGICPAETIGNPAGAFSYVSGSEQIASQQVSPQGPAALAFGYDYQGNISAIGKYDAAGQNITQAVCLRHDALGRLVLVGSTTSSLTAGGTACVADGEVTSALGRFKYDSRNRRVARQVNGQWVYVVPDAAGNPLSELVLTGDTNTPWVKARDYVWLEGRLVAQVEYSGMTGPVYTYYAHVDHLGQPRALTNQNGQLVWRSFQRPYGEAGEKTVVDPVSGKTVVTNLRLPGQYDERLLSSLGLQGPYYNWNRWYLPGVGRYLELDPIAMRGRANGEFGPDWYNYSLDNPNRYTDPTGLAIWVCNRKSEGLPGNHAYYWDDRNGTSCGRDQSAGGGDASGSRNDRGPTVDACVKVPGSDGREDEVMNCCKKRANEGRWAPGFNDCHDAVARCLKATQLPDVKAPGGRAGPPCDPCK